MRLANPDASSRALNLLLSRLHRAGLLEEVQEEARWAADNPEAYHPVSLPGYNVFDASKAGAVYEWAVPHLQADTDILAHLYECFVEGVVRGERGGERALLPYMEQGQREAWMRVSGRSMRSSQMWQVTAAQFIAMALHHTERRPVHDSGGVVLDTLDWVMAFNTDSVWSNARQQLVKAPAPRYDWDAYLTQPEQRLRNPLAWAVRNLLDPFYAWAASAVGSYTVSVAQQIEGAMQRLARLDEATEYLTAEETSETPLHDVYQMLVPTVLDNMKFRRHLGDAIRYPRMGKKPETRQRWARALQDLREGVI